MTPLNEADDLVPTRQSLLTRLKDWNDQDSWKVFFETYWKLIYTAAMKAGLSEEEAQDVVQETVISVCRAMPSFEYDRSKGSFKSYLLRLTSWRIGDQMRRRRREIASLASPTSTSTGTATAEKVADPAGVALEAIWDEEWESNLMHAAIERVKRKVDAKSYQIYDLSVFKGYPVARVVHALQVSRPRIYLAKHRISNLIKKEIIALRNKPI